MYCNECLPNFNPKSQTIGLGWWVGFGIVTRLAMGHLSDVFGFGVCMWGFLKFGSHMWENSKISGLGGFGFYMFLYQELIIRANFSLLNVKCYLIFLEKVKT